MTPEECADKLTEAFRESLHLCGTMSVTYEFRRAIIEAIESAAEAERERLIAPLPAIVADLFTSGIGGRADRLVLTIDGPPKRDLGGWAETAMVDRITKAIRKAALLAAGVREVE